MRKILFILTCLAPAFVFGQDLKEYKAANGKTYHVGDTLKIGMGSNPEGNFKYIQSTPPPFLPPRPNGNGRGVRKDYSMSSAVIRKIKTASQMTGPEKVTFTVKAGGIGTLDVWIAEAIAACEVTPCANSSASIRGGGSVADELLKLKKLLDGGGITQKEYDTQKKKLLGE